MKSLRLRLVLLLSLSLGIAWLATAWFTHVESREEIDRLFDAQLAQSAQVLLTTTRYEVHERLEHGDYEVRISHEYEQKLIFQIWDKTGLLMRSSTAPINALAGKNEGYSESVIKDTNWRVLTKWDANHEFMVQVAEPLSERMALAQHVALKIFMPILLVFPVLGLSIWFGIGAGLMPLQQVKQEVKKRTENRLEPIAMDNVPEEIEPLVEALNELFARLGRAFESERRFTADAAHELRTPLAALNVQAQVALRSAEETERNGALANVLHGVERANRLVEQLLTLARVDPEVANASFKPVDLQRLARAVMVEVDVMAHAKQIEMHLEERPLEGARGCHVLGDEAQLAILLRNLLDNAIRYTPVGGSVSVAVRQAEGVALEVLDTGPGIPVNEREQVQQRFYRIAGSGEEGSGVGLSIVRRIAELHGARLELRNGEQGSGLLARVVWPTN